ncbi:hemagglutinin repeat-containing protein [Serratia marcescens]|uniref:hemagglutinin repeat-containing protein n=1 Tax=Serratia marcescens TaxID=615 RepID=UPI003ED96859
MTLNTATERESALSEERSQKKGFLKKSSSHSVAHDATTREKGSLLSGNSVSVSAGNDLTVTGSAIAADQDVNLQAGGNVDIGAATETDTHYRLEEKKKSGLLGSGAASASPLANSRANTKSTRKAGPKAKASAPSAAARAASTSRRATNCTSAAPIWWRPRIWLLPATA